MKHIPVLLKESIELLNIKSNGKYLDLTLGRAGHSSEILKKLNTGFLYAFDLDKEAISESDIRLKKISNNYKLYHDNFRNFSKYFDFKFDGILLDLGVSSPMLDDPSRGFSYMNDGPLDMRMNQDETLTAEHVVNNYSLEKLCEIFRNYGEENDAYRIAKNIIKHRNEKLITTTLELSNIIKEVKKISNGHPAKKVFQALRIEVNHELESLKIVISEALNHLNKNGRLVIISFHSLEDRIVKNAFNEVTRVIGNRNDEIEINTKPLEYKLVIKKIITPTPEELKINPRSQSSKLRVIEKI